MRWTRERVDSRQAAENSPSTVELVGMYALPCVQSRHRAINQSPVTIATRMHPSSLDSFVFNLLALLPAHPHILYFVPSDAYIHSCYSCSSTRPSLQLLPSIPFALFLFFEFASSFFPPPEAPVMRSLAPVLPFFLPPSPAPIMVVQRATTVL